MFKNSCWTLSITHWYSNVSQKNGILSHTTAEPLNSQKHLSHDGIHLKIDTLYLTVNNLLRLSRHCALLCCMSSVKCPSFGTITMYKYLGMWWVLTLSLQKPCIFLCYCVCCCGSVVTVVGLEFIWLWFWQRRCEEKM